MKQAHAPLQRIRSLGGVGALLGGSAAFAHQGHGQLEPSSAAHWLLEPLHGGVGLALTFGAVLIWRALRSDHARRPQRQRVRFRDRG